jgi:hypothetical protein
MAHGHMNVEIRTEAAQFPEKEYINGIFLAVYICLFSGAFMAKCMMDWPSATDDRQMVVAWRGLGRCRLSCGSESSSDPFLRGKKKRKLNASLFFLKIKYAFPTSFLPKIYLFKILASHSSFSNPHLSFLLLTLTGEE